MPQLNYRHLRYFWAIAHDGSLTKAAERLHLSQSALSVQLAKLESQLGHPLFDRLGRSLVLNEAGRIALDYADTMFQAGDELLSTLRSQPTVNRPILKVGALTTLSRNFQMEFLRPLMGREDISVVVRSGTLRELLAQLEAQAVDVVLTNSAVRRDASTVLHSHLLDRQPVSLVGRPQVDAPAFRFPTTCATSRCCCRAWTATSASISIACSHSRVSARSFGRKWTTWRCCDCWRARATA